MYERNPVIPPEMERVEMPRWCEGWRAETITFAPGFGRDVIDAERMFLACESLQEVNFPEGFGENINNTGEMFAECGLLQAVNLPERFGRHVRNARGMFADCTSLQEVTLPTRFGRNILDATRMFFGCQNLTELVLPEGFGIDIRMAESMFEECMSLRELTLPDGFGANIRNADHMFAECQFETISVREDVSPLVLAQIPEGVNIVTRPLPIPPPRLSMHPHPLHRSSTIPSVAYLNGYRCDQCGRHGFVPIPLHCDTCNYDLCADCATEYAALERAADISMFVFD